ncbi:MAG: GAF domain-containing sensor histidine kinase [Chloroflexi bacterium]|nr:GAF domain-containing sensor histidine kinase [Chloroflexota bacterium]
MESSDSAQAAFMASAAEAQPMPEALTATDWRACLRTVNQIAHLMAQHLDLMALLQRALVIISEDFKFATLRLLLLNRPAADRLICRAGIGPATLPLAIDALFPTDQGIIGAAIQLRQVVWIDNAPNLSYLAIPIIISAQLEGILYIESQRLVLADDLTNLAIVADQLGVAIENACLFDQLQQHLAETQLMFETSHNISSARTVAEVVAAYLNHIAARRRYACTVVLYEFDAQGQFVARTVKGRWSPEHGLSSNHDRQPHERDALDDLLDAGETVTIADVRTDPRVAPGLRRMQEAEQRLAMAFIPLIVRSQRIGLVVLTDANPHEWSHADLHPYQVTAEHLAIVIDNRRQQRLLYAHGERIAVLDERQRLARDLHDSVTQMIFSITLISQTVTSAWQRDPAEGERRVNRLIELSQLALAEMRSLLTDLHPIEREHPQAVHYAQPTPHAAPTEPSKLMQRLHKYATEVIGDQLQINFDTTSYEQHTAICEDALYRIIQEALNNVSKHAHASHVAVTLRVHGNRLILSIQDDGIGFDQSSQPASQGLGLYSMRKRVETCGGTLTITLGATAGTMVQAIIPREAPHVRS